MTLNILVVDDSSIVRKMIIKTLGLSGIPIGETYEAGNGIEGLGVLEQHWVDLVFLDINMPVMNGEEMIERIRGSLAWSDIPVVVVSTEGSQTRIEKLRQMNAHFIHKPFTPEKIAEIATRLMRPSHGKTS